ncbi:hypothetical protein CLU79DRAFT_750062 [Phycomyces nitens]|nr:hypothetical protein CLU79DRAFT_750062 [Phycomyces nitens]
MNNELPISVEEIRELLAFKRQWEQEKQQRLELSYQLPDEIRGDLELPRAALKKICSTFARAQPSYEGGRCTRPLVVNKAIAPDIQKSTVPTSSAIQGKLKDAEKFRTLANAAAVLYEEFGSILADPSYEDHPLLDSMRAFEERTRRSAVFAYAAAVSAEDDVKVWSDKACGVPEHLRAYEEEDGKELLYDPEFLKTLKQDKFERTVIARAAGSGNQRQGSGFPQRGRGNGRGFDRGRGRGNQSRSFPPRQPSQPGTESQPRPPVGGGQ